MESVGAEGNVHKDARRLGFLESRMWPGPVRNFVFVSHTITREGRRKYGEEDNPGAQRRVT